MNVRKVGQILLIAIPVAATSFLAYVRMPPASGFRHSEAALTHHRFACANGTETGWLLVRFDSPLALAPEATLDGRKPLTTWLTTREGVQWVNIAGPATPTEQPALFAWQSGVELHLKLPAPARVDDWVLHRATEKPDSASAVVQRRLLIGAMTVLVVLSFVATFVAQKIFETPEDLDTKKYVRMLIEACEVGSRAETEQAHRLLRAVVLDGQSLEAAMASLEGEPKKKRLLAIRAVGKLKAKLLTFHEELSVFKSRLERAR